MPVEQIHEQHPHRGDWLREIVFGLNDGLVTTLVFIMAVSEIAPARLLLVVLGEVLARGISMALGGYLSARTARQILDQRIATERFEIEHEPEEEQAELRAIYRDKGFSGPLLQRVVDHLTSDRERWHRAMVHDELGVVEDTHIRPWQQGVQVELSFVVGVRAHRPHSAGAGSGESPLYAPATAVGGTRIPRGRHCRDPGRCGVGAALAWSLSSVAASLSY